MRLVVLRTETRHDNVRFPFPNCPDNVGQDFFTVPDPQRFGRAFRETEIDRASEKLMSVIDFAGGKQFVSPNETRSLAELRSEKILPAVATRHGEICGVVERSEERRVGKECRSRW